MKNPRKNLTDTYKASHFYLNTLVSECECELILDKTGNSEMGL